MEVDTIHHPLAGNTLDPAILMDKYFLSKKKGRAALAQTSLHFLDLITTTNIVTSPCFQGEIQNYVDALLDRNSCSDIFYLEVLAMLPAPKLQDLIISLINLRGKMDDIEVRSALLFSLTKVIPTSIEDDRVADLISQTCQLLLIEAKQQRTSCYCNPYREAVVMRFVPLLLARKMASSERQFYMDLVPEATKFLMSCAFKTIPGGCSICLTTEEVWDSLSQLLFELSSAWNFKDSSWKYSLALWNTRHHDLPSLSTWWINFKKWTAKNSDSSNNQLSFCYQFSFWSFLLYWYSLVKSECDLPERRPFLLSLIPFSEAVIDMADTESIPNQSRIQLEAKLKDIFQLAQDVLQSLSSENDNQFFKAIVEELQLDESAIFLTFRSDLAETVTSTLPINCSDLHPTWLRTQLAVSNLNSMIKLNSFSPAIFAEISKVVSQFFRPGSYSTERKRSEIPFDQRLIFIWDDSEIIDYFCRIILDYMLKQPLETASDEFLAALLVFIQPISSTSISALRNIINAISFRGKFVFKKFFSYIISPDLLAEIGQVLQGTVVMELTPEPLIGAASIHKTRGANRGSTDALLVELQKHSFNSSLSSNPYQAVMLFMKHEKESLMVTIFQQVAVPAILRRGRSGAT